MSDQQLAAKLLFLGVQPPTKISRTTGKEAFAFAKTDKEFTALLEHPKPMVQALVAARLGHKSTLEETRTERLLSISRSVEQMPVPLKYSGAHTHRFSGDWKINLQNLVRGSEIRRAFKAPRDHVVVSVDASQIEARFNATVAGQTDLMEAFRQGRDVYAEFAQDIYGYEITKETFPDERFVGKTGILSLGYGSSWPVFQNMCRVKGGVTLPDGAAAQVVTVYRARYHMIQELWKTAHQSIIPRLASSRQTDFAELLPPGQSDGWNMWGPAQVLANALLLPNGNRLRYMNLRAENHDGQWNWLYERSEQTFKLYGAKLVENLIQALAFVHIMEVALRVKHLTNGMLMPAHQVHDELIYVVHAGIAGMVRDLVVKEMSTPPSWLPKAPLAAEGHIGESYGNVK
jgi:DNA polymerase